MINKTAVVMECTVEGVDSDGILERLPQHEADTMCRIIINGINRLFNHILSSGFSAAFMRLFAHR